MYPFEELLIKSLLFLLRLAIGVKKVGLVPTVGWSMMKKTKNLIFVCSVILSFDKQGQNSN